MKPLKLSCVLILLALGLGLNVENLSANGPAISGLPQQNDNKIKQPSKTKEVPEEVTKSTNPATPQQAPSHNQISSEKKDDQQEKSQKQVRITLDILLTMFNGMLALLTYFLVRIGWRQVDASLLNAKAAMLNAEATSKTVQTMQDNSERELRAYVGITMAAMHHIGEFLVVRTALTNTGHTPAYNVRVWSMLKVFEPSQHIRAFPAIEPVANFAMLSPQTPLEIGARTKDGFTQDTIADVVNGIRPVYFWGKVEYRDVFKKEWKTEFRLVARFHPESGHWRFFAAPEGNNAD